MKHPLRCVSAAALAAVLAACSTTDETEPVGIGHGTDEFKKSPCACYERSQPPATPDYLKRLRHRLQA